MLIGQTTMTWANVERIFDELIAWYQHAATALESKHPKNFTDKMKYLSKMEGDHRLNPKLRQWLGKVRVEAKDLADRRHELVHGLVWRRALKSGEWQSQRVRYDGPFARLTLTRLTDDDFRAALTDISALLQELAPKVWVIAHPGQQAYTPAILARARDELGLS